MGRSYHSFGVEKNDLSRIEDKKSRNQVVLYLYTLYSLHTVDFLANTRPTPATHRAFRHTFLGNYAAENSKVI
jgi:hypothetical protein